MSMPHGVKRSADDDKDSGEQLPNGPAPSKRPSIQGPVEVPQTAISEELTMAPVPQHWIFVYTLGKGAFGNVVLVHTNELDSAGWQYIHNEFVTKHMDVTADKLALVMNEVKLHRKCRENPNILFIGLCLCQPNDGGYRVQMCLEYAACGDMCLMAQKPKTEKHVAYVCEGVLNALAHVHSLDIVHGDISLKNVLMTHTGVIKLCDFGCARSIEQSRLDREQMIVGTPGFIAPEVMNVRGYDTKADMWNLASFTFYLISGYNPFKSGPIFNLEIYGEQIKERYEPVMPPEFTDDLKDFIKLMYFYEPAERKSASEMLQHVFLTEKVTQHRIAFQYKNLRREYGVDLPDPDDPIRVPISLENA